MLEIEEEDEEVSRQVRLVEGWIKSVKSAQLQDDDSIKESKSLETFLCALGDDFLGAKESLKKEVDKQEQEWKSLARVPLALSELQDWPRLIRLGQRKSCKDLTSSEVSDLFSELKACWKKHRETWPDKGIPPEPPSLKPYFRGDLYEADPLQNEKRANAVTEFFVRNAKWRERWDQVAVPACVKRALRTAKDDRVELQKKQCSGCGMWTFFWKGLQESEPKELLTSCQLHEFDPPNRQ